MLRYYTIYAMIISMMWCCCYCVGFVSRATPISRAASRQKLMAITTSTRQVESIGIIGGGLAGLSAAYHLIDIATKTRPNDKLHITIYDKTNVGEGGASAVAGGLMHPFSPRGKIIHFGEPALEISKVLVKAAAKHKPDCVLRDHLFRVALTSKNVSQLQDTASKYGTLATWLSQEDLYNNYGIDCLGGLKLSNGCQVIHVPTYLEGLLIETVSKASQLTSGNVEWELIKPNDKEVDQKLQQHDSIIMSAGSGLLHDDLVEEDSLPVQLVRGQSIELEMANKSDEKATSAILSGKYISPLPSLTQEGNDSTVSSQRYVIGATHEFKPTPLPSSEVKEELRTRTYQLATHLWEEGKVDKITTGVRMQSNRGIYGRMPIIGQYNLKESDIINHDHKWIFTGLSSRGLIYHGLFGKWLANAVLNDSEECLQDEFEDFDWWRRKQNKK